MTRAKRPLTRREFLIGAGLLAGGAAACACGGVATTAMLLTREKPTDVPRADIIVSTNTPIPRFERPITIPREDWGAWPPDHQAANEYGFYSEGNPEGWRIYEGNIEDAYQTVIAHHSAFYEETDLKTVLAVQKLHREDRRWADVAYHFLIGQTGIIYEGRDWTVRGTHVEGYNSGSLGVCLLGNFMVQAPTAIQLNSALQLIAWASERLQLTHIAAHRNFNPQTECPGDNLYTYIGQFAAVAGLEIGIGGYIGPADDVFCPCCACQTNTAT